MNLLTLTTLPERKRICIVPDFFILHQPRRTILTIGGKPAFNQTTIMSAINPMFSHQVTEDYASVVKAITSQDKDFVEFRHAETGTLFLLHPRNFELIEPGASWPDGNGQVEQLCLVSLWNPALWVPIAEPTFEHACDKMGYELD
jgi:hypothetical protein